MNTVLKTLCLILLLFGCSRDRDENFQLAKENFEALMGSSTSSSENNTNNSSNISINSNGTCVCENATVGEKAVIDGKTYTVVDNSTIAGQIANGNYNLCTTKVTDMSEFCQ